jgi:hypothetical protein
METKEKIKSKEKNRKGMFFSISTLFLVIVLMALAMISGNTTRIEKDLASERSYELSTSVEQGIIELFNNFSNVNVSVIKEPSGRVSVMVTEKLTSKDIWGAEFLDRLKKFASFIEDQDPHIRINLSSDEEIKSLPVTIRPHNIKYIRCWGSPQDPVGCPPGHLNLMVQPEAFNFDYYEVTIDLEEEVINHVGETIHSAVDGFPLRVIVKSNTQPSHYDETYYLDLTRRSSVTVHREGGGTVTLYCDEDSLETWTSVNPQQSVGALVSTKVGNLTRSIEKVTVVLYDSMVNVNFSQLGVYQMGDVAVGEE